MFHYYMNNSVLTLPFLPTIQQTENYLYNGYSKILKKEANQEKCVELSDFLCRKKRGCKSYRKVITCKIDNYIPHNTVKIH